MRKEVIFALSLGGILGLILAIGIFRANLALSIKNPTQSKSKSSTPLPVKNSESNFIVVASPENESVSPTSTLQLTGLSPKGSTIIVSAEEKDYVLFPEEDGKFSTNVNLIGGLNELKLFAFNNDSKFETNLLIAYSSEFFKNQFPPSSDSKNASNEGTQTIREKVQEKIQEILSKPVFYTGIITDVSENTIQVKNGQGNLKLLSFDKTQTSFIRTGEKASKTINYSDLAIGDFILAFGFIDSSNVLQSKRIIITVQFKPSERTAFYSKVKKVGSSLLVITNSNNDDITIDLSQKPKITKLDEGVITQIKLNQVSEGDSLIISGTPALKEKSSFVARRIHKI